MRINWAGLATLLRLLTLLLCGEHLLSCRGLLLSTHLSSLLMHAWVVADVGLSLLLLLDSGRVDKVIGLGVIWIEECWHRRIQTHVARHRSEAILRAHAIEVAKAELINAGVEVVVHAIAVHGHVVQGADGQADLLLELTIVMARAIELMSLLFVEWRVHRGSDGRRVVGALVKIKERIHVELLGLQMRGSGGSDGGRGGAASGVLYLGHQIDTEGVRPTKQNVQKLLDMPVPKDTAGVKSFLATANFYRRALHNVASVGLPLTKLLKKGVRFEWNDAQQEAFDTIKKMLTEAPLLAYPDRNQVQILTTDASSKGLGAILSQSPDGSSEGETVIAYASRTLRGAETRYSATHLEAFALVWSVNYFREYLSGRKWIANIDHSALTFIFKNPNPSPKINRWAAALMGYDFELRYCKGETNPADSLSRLI